MTTAHWTQRVEGALEFKVVRALGQTERRRQEAVDLKGNSRSFQQLLARTHINGWQSFTGATC